MKILVVSQYFYPEQFRVNDIVSELVRRGHEVSVLTGLPNYPEGEIYIGYEKSYGKTEDYYGAQVYRCKLRPRKNGAMNLAFNYLSFVIEGKKTLKKIKSEFDVIYVYEPSPITVALPAIWYKKKYGIPVYLYCMDQWPESVLGNGVGKRGLIYTVAKAVSKYVYQNVDIIGNKCEEFSNYINSVCGIDKNKMRVLYEHAENSYLSVSDRPIDNGSVDFMFLGNIGSTQNCERIVEAASLIKTDKQFMIHFVGDGSALETLKKRSVALGLDGKVVFHGRYPLNEINAFYEVADCCMLTLSGDSAVGLTPPGKLYGYMAAGRPIIAAAKGPTCEILKRFNCGLYAAPDDVEGLAKHMMYAINYIEKIQKMGENGRRAFLENYTIDSHMNALIEQLTSLSEKG